MFRSKRPSSGMSIRNLKLREMPGDGHIDRKM